MVDRHHSALGCPVDMMSRQRCGSGLVVLRVLGVLGVLAECVLSYRPLELGVSWTETRTYRPVDYMVDLTNDLAVDVLYEHNFLNDNNIAFSPYGLAGILVALYEGVDGFSSLQIREAIKLPANRDVVRIGFRDIHRRLRSYFIPKEGFLAGLAFNNDNVTFRQEYKSILQFYGYDFHPTPSENETVRTTTTESNSANDDATALTTLSTTESSTESTTTEMMTTMTTEMQTLPIEVPTTMSPSTMDSETTFETTNPTQTTEISISTTSSSAEDTTMSMSTAVDVETTFSTAETASVDSSRKKRALFNYDLDSPEDRFGQIFFRDSSYEATRGLQHQRAFLANGHNRIQITYMAYDTAMEFAYVPYLRSSALKLPLDTAEYYLLILLPEYEFGVNQLVKDLKSERAPTLRQINYLMTTTHVRAWVPTFMLKGFIVLTTDLQKLGICDAFEPKQDDFKPMTDEKNIYVRNIEQAITVTIRKYSEPAVKKRYAQNQSPVNFAATHPFLYFVMDAGIHVSLMAGKIVNPLNSRIL